MPVVLKDEERLSPQELKVLTLVGKGLRYKDVSTVLGIKEQVVKNYMRSIFEKWGCNSGLQAVLMAVKLGLIKTS